MAIIEIMMNVASWMRYSKAHADGASNSCVVKTVMSVVSPFTVLAALQAIAAFNNVAGLNTEDFASVAFD